MNATLRRRWYRFNLRTMFALITLVCLGCGWVGYQLDWIRQRHGFLKSHQWPQSSNTKEIGYTICKPIYGVRAPGMLWVFGERGEGAIYLDHKYSAEEAKQIQAMFPEARVSNICYEIGRPYYTPSQTDWR